MQFKTEYDKSDLENMAALGENNYTKQNDIANMPFLEWQCFDNPAGRARVAVATDEDSGEIVGEITQMPMKFRYFGKEIVASCLVNSLIKKEYRKISLFYQLQVESFDSYKDNAFAFAVPNPFSYPLFSRLFFCKTVAQLPLLLLPVHPKALVQAKISQGFAKIIPNISYKGVPCHISQKIAVSLLSADEITVFDAFWEKVKDKYPIMGVRTSDYMTWRYIDIPTRDYSIFVAKNGADIEGYCIVRRDELQGIRTGFLMDFLVLPGHKEAAMALLRHSIAYLNENGVDLIGTLMLPHCEEYRYLKRYGFLNCPEKFLPQPFPLIIKRNEISEDGRLDEDGNWYLTMGDYDAV